MFPYAIDFQTVSEICYQTLQVATLETCISNLKQLEDVHLGEKNRFIDFNGFFFIKSDSILYANFQNHTTTFGKECIRTMLHGVCIYAYKIYANIFYCQ